MLRPDFAADLVRSQIEELVEDLRGLIAWNAPDHEFTRRQVRTWLDDALEEAFETTARETR